MKAKAIANKFIASTPDLDNREAVDAGLKELINQVIADFNDETKKFPMNDKKPWFELIEKTEVKWSEICELLSRKYKVYMLEDIGFRKILKHKQPRVYADYQAYNRQKALKKR